MGTLGRMPTRSRHVHAFRAHSLLATALIGLLVAACGDDGRTLDTPTAPLPVTTVPVVTLPPEVPAAAPLGLVAPWPDGAQIPARYVCDGDGVSPALTWSNIPFETSELAVTVTDLDAGQATLWIVYAITPDRTGLVEGVIPDGALEWVNTLGSTGWQPPCPPLGESHRYQFTVHALNQQLEVADDASAAEVIATLNLIAIDQASVTGTVVRSE